MTLSDPILMEKKMELIMNEGTDKSRYDGSFQPFLFFSIPGNEGYLVNSDKFVSPLSSVIVIV